MAILLRLNEVKDSVSRLAEKFSDLDDSISNSKSFDWESDYKGKINFEFDFLNGQVETLLLLTASQFVPGMNGNPLDFKELLSQKADDLFAEITRIAQIEKSLQSKVLESIHNFSMDVFDAIGFDQQPELQFKQKMERAVGDLWEKTTNNNQGFVEEIQRKIEQFDLEIRGEDSVDKYLSQIHNQLVLSELSLFDQIRSQVVSIANRIKLAKTVQKESQVHTELLKKCSTLNALVEDATRNAKSKERTIENIFQNKSNTTFKFRSFCDELTDELQTQRKSPRSTITNWNFKRTQSLKSFYQTTASLYIPTESNTNRIDLSPRTAYEWAPFRTSAKTEFSEKQRKDLNENSPLESARPSKDFQQKKLSKLSPLNNLAQSIKEKRNHIPKNFNSIQNSQTEPSFHRNFGKTTNDDYELHERAITLLDSEESCESLSRNLETAEQNNELQQKLTKAQHKLRKESQEKLQILDELSSLRASLLSFKSSNTTVPKSASPKGVQQIEVEFFKKFEHLKKATLKSKEISNKNQETRSSPVKKSKVSGVKGSPSKKQLIISKLNSDEFNLDVDGVRRNSSENQHLKLPQKIQPVRPSSNQSSETQLMVKSDALIKSKNADKSIEKLNEELKKEADSVIDSQKQHIMQLEESNLRFKDAISSLTQQTSNLENEKTQLKAILDRIQVENEELILKNKEMYGSINSTAKVRAKQKEELLSRLRIEIQELQQALEKQRESFLQGEKLLKSQIFDLQKANKELIVKTEILEESLNEKDLYHSSQRAREEKVAEKLRIKLHEQESQLEEARRNYQELDIQCSLLKSRCQKLEKQNEKHVSNSSQRTDVMNESQLRAVELENENRNLRIENVSLKAQNESLKLRNAEFKTKLNEDVLKLEEEAERRKVLEIEKEQMISLVASQVQNLDGHEKQKRELIEQINQLLNSRTKVEAELMKCQALIDKKTAEIKALEDELNLARPHGRAEISSLNNPKILESNSATHNINMDQQREQEKSDSSTILSLKNELEREKMNYEQNISILTLKINMIQSQNEVHSQENAQVIRKNLEDKKKFEVLIHEKTTEIFDLHKKIQELAAENKRFIEEEKNYKVKQEEMEKVVKQEQSKVEEIQNLVIKFKLQNNHLKENYENALESNAELESINSALILQVNELKKSNLELRDEENLLNKENQRLAQKAREEDLRASQKKLDYVHQISELKEMLKADENMIRQLEIENNTLKTTIKSKDLEPQAELHAVENYENSIEEELSRKNKDLSGRTKEESDTMQSNTSKDQLQNETSRKLPINQSKINEIKAQQITRELQDKVEKLMKKTDMTAFESKNLSENRLKPRSEAHLYIKEEDLLEKDYLKYIQLRNPHQQKTLKNYFPDNEFRARSLLSEHDFKELKDYIQKFSNELKIKSNIVELLKQAVKAVMEKNKQQIEELNRKNEKAELQLRRDFAAVEAYLKDQLMALLQEATRFKRVNIKAKEAEDSKSIILEIKRILIDTLEENSNIKKSKHKEKDDNALEYTHTELLAARSELNKKIVENENLKNELTKLTDEKQEMIKIFEQAYRVRTVLTPVKEDQLRDVLEASPSVKAVAANKTFIQDAMLYHHFLSECVFSEPEISIPWATQQNEKKSAAVQVLQEQIQNLAAQLKSREDAIKAQAKTWTSVVSKIDNRLKKLIIIADQEGTHTQHIDKISLGQQNSPIAPTSPKDILFAEGLAKKLHILEAAIHNLNEIRHKQKKIVEASDDPTDSPNKDLKSMQHNEKKLDQSDPKTTHTEVLSFPDLALKAAKEAKERSDEKVLLTVKTTSPMTQTENSQWPSVTNLDSGREIGLANITTKFRKDHNEDNPIEPDSPAFSPRKNELEEHKEDFNQEKSIEIDMLHEEINRTKTLCEQERFINNQLSEQLRERDYLEKKLEAQGEKLKKENFELSQKLKFLETNVFERDQLKHLFGKAIDGMFKNSKDVIAVFKVIMSILGFNQDQKDTFDLKLREFGKKSVFANII